MPAVSQSCVCQSSASWGFKGLCPFGAELRQVVTGTVMTTSELIKDATPKPVVPKPKSG